MNKHISLNRFFCFEQPVLMITFKLVFGNEDKGNGLSNSLTSHFSDAYFPQQLCLGIILTQDQIFWP